MAKASKKKKKASFKLPPQLPWAAALLIALFLLLALVFHNKGGLGFLSQAQIGAGDQSWFGPIGAYFSKRLIKFFGYVSFGLFPCFAVWPFLYSRAAK